MGYRQQSNRVGLAFLKIFSGTCLSGTFMWPLRELHFRISHMISVTKATM